MKSSMLNAATIEYWNTWFEKEFDRTNKIAQLIKKGNSTMATTFNPAQLATFETAFKIADLFNEAGVGKGVKPFSTNQATSGIYLPTWVAGPGGFEIPNGTGPNGERLFFLHFRFNNGFEGVNVGLCQDKFARYPNSPAYVISALRAEIEQGR